MQMPDINKKMESALIPMELAARLRKASEIRGIAKSDIVYLALMHDLANIELGPEDYQWMKEEVKKNIDRRKRSIASAIKRVNAKLSALDEKVARHLAELESNHAEQEPQS